MRLSTARSALARTALLLVAIAMLSALPIQASWADPPHGDDRGDRGDRGHGRPHRAEHHRPEYHRYPVYAPPPVYYPHEESPGIRLFIPIEIR